MARKRRASARVAERLLGYVRVSSEDQRESGLSLGAQRAAIAAYGAAHGYEIVETIEDAAVSGSVPLFDRPGGARVAELLALGEIGGVVATRIDRLFRSARDAQNVATAWDTENISLHVLDLRLDTRSPIGRLFFGLLTSFSQFEIALLSQRTSAALRHLAAQGVTLGAAGLGWERTDDRDADGRLVVREVTDEIETVARIHALRRSGISFAAIATTLTNEERASKKGGRWWPATVRQVLMRTSPPNARAA